MTNFEAVGDFHRKFLLEHYKPGSVPRHISREMAEFRLRFLAEELNELIAAYEQKDLAGIADALVDLTYIALGTAHLHGLPWEALFAEVQAANMKKERCEIDHTYMSAQFGLASPDYVNGCYYRDKDGVHCGLSPFKHSKRGSINDVLKPKGWTPPDIEGVLISSGYVNAG